MKKKMLVAYVRKNRTPYGVVVAIGRNLVGWSKCNKKDKWDKVKGLELAVGRATITQLDLSTIPPDMVEPAIKMITRSRRYY